MNIRYQLLAAFIIFYTNTAFTQDFDISDISDVILGKSFIFNSKILDQERDIYISLPDDYAYSGMHYPVAYVLDSPGHFVMSRGIIHDLSRYEKAPKMIIVGIGNGIVGENNDISKLDRNRDMAPSVNIRGNGGGSLKFTAFLKQELIPYINNNYRTNHYDLLIGHSMGGLFAANTLLSEPEMFDAFIAFSPWMQWNDGEPVEAYRQFLESGGRFSNKRMFLTIAEGDTDESKQYFYQFVDLLDQYSPEGLIYEHRFMEGQTHGSLGFISVYEGSLKLFGDWIPEQDFANLDDLKSYYKNLSAKLGFEVDVPERFLIGFANSFRQADPSKTLEIMNYNIELHPNGLFALYARSTMLRSLGRLEEALADLNRANTIRENYVKDPSGIVIRLIAERNRVIAEIAKNGE